MMKTDRRVTPTVVEGPGYDSLLSLLSDCQLTEGTLLTGHKEPDPHQVGMYHHNGYVVFRCHNCGRATLRAKAVGDPTCGRESCSQEI